MAIFTFTHQYFYELRFSLNRPSPMKFIALNKLIEKRNDRRMENETAHSIQTFHSWKNLEIQAGDLLLLVIVAPNG